MKYVFMNKNSCIVLGFLSPSLYIRKKQNFVPLIKLIINTMIENIWGIIITENMNIHISQLWHDSLFRECYSCEFNIFTETF